MQKFILYLICFSCLFTLPIRGNDDLIELLHLAVQSSDLKLVNDVTEIILKQENNNIKLLEAIAKYGSKGKIDFSLHKAIKDKNIFASILLIPHTKDVNARQETEYCWRVNGSGYSGTYTEGKNPLELSLEVEMIEIIPFLLMKTGNPHIDRKIGFFIEQEENLDYLQHLGYSVSKKTCAKSRKECLQISAPGGFSRTFIGELICKNRLDIIEMLQKMFKIDWNKNCCTALGINFPPLQLALAIERYEIAYFLIEHGARIQ